MSNAQGIKRKQGFILLGTGGNFSTAVLHELLKENAIPLAFIQSGRRRATPDQGIGDISLEVSRSVTTLAGILQANHIPHYVADPGSLAHQVADLQADFLLVACWPELLTLSVLQSVSCAALNLHPSLLPAYRGRDPIAEQLKAGDKNYGISLHLLNEFFDTGDIVLQQSLPLHNQSYQQIEQACARQGAKLFIKALNTFQHPGWSLLPQPSAEIN